jgi:BolA family transcriptional regulator, general stress-responsive regulator
MTRQQRMEQRLTAVFSPLFLEVRDDSHHHAGHGGARPEGETHYHVTLKSADFIGKTRVAMHRAINDAVKEEFEAGLHALSVTASA